MFRIFCFVGVLCLLLVVMVLLFLVLMVQVVGYCFGIQSVVVEGMVNVNGVEVVDVSMLFVNFVGIMWFNGWNFFGVLDYVDFKICFMDEGFFILLFGLGLQLCVIGIVGDMLSFVKFQVVLYVYLSYKVFDMLVYGLGVFVFWGIKLNYWFDWGGCYNLQKVELQFIFFNFNVVWKILFELLFVVGLNVQYMEGKLCCVVFYVFVYVVGLLNVVYQVVVGGVLGLVLQLQQQVVQIFGNLVYDGFIVVDGKDWGLGFNFVLLWEFMVDICVGVSYCSSVSYCLCGSVDWMQLSNLFVIVLVVIIVVFYNGVLVFDYNDFDVSFVVCMFELLFVYGFYQFMFMVVVMVDFMIICDLCLKQLCIDFVNLMVDFIIVEYWKDSIKVLIGV